MQWSTLSDASVNCYMQLKLIVHTHNSLKWYGGCNYCSVCVCETGDSSLFVDQFCPSCDMACSFSFSKRFRDATTWNSIYHPCTQHIAAEYFITQWKKILMFCDQPWNIHKLPLLSVTYVSRDMEKYDLKHNVI